MEERITDFEGMTNGEVIQALFPNAIFEDAFIDSFVEITFVGSGNALLKKEWLNQEYNGSFCRSRGREDV